MPPHLFTMTTGMSPDREALSTRAAGMLRVRVPTSRSILPLLAGNAALAVNNDCETVTLLCVCYHQRTCKNHMHGIHVTLPSFLQHC